MGVLNRASRFFKALVKLGIMGTYLCKYWEWSDE